jgi:hypothetical protein
MEDMGLKEYYGNIFEAIGDFIKMQIDAFRLGTFVYTIVVLAIVMTICLKMILKIEKKYLADIDE